MQLVATHAEEITNLAEYVDRQEDPLIQVIRTHQLNSDSVVLKRARCLNTELLKETRKISESVAEKKEGRWQGKRMHRLILHNLDEKLVDIENSYC